MSYDGQIVRIEKLSNGYEVEVCDPDQKAKNKNPKTPYADPWKSYAYSTKEEVIAFLTKVLDTLVPEDEDDSMETNFQRAITEDN